MDRLAKEMRAEEKELGLDQPVEDGVLEEEADSSPAASDADSEAAGSASNRDVDSGADSEDEAVLAAALQESLDLGRGSDDVDQEAQIEVGDAAVDDEGRFERGENGTSAKETPADPGDADKAPVSTEAPQPEMSKKDKRRAKEAKRKAEAEAAAKDGPVSRICRPCGVIPPLSVPPLCDVESRSLQLVWRGLSLAQQTI